MEPLRTKEKKKLILKLLEKFSTYDFFDETYIIGLVNSVEKEFLEYDGIKIEYGDIANINPSYYIYYKCIDFLNYKLCRVALTDDDVLLQIMLDYTYVIEFVCRKLNCEVDYKYDEYIKECVAVYNGEIPLYLFIAKYLVSRIRGKNINAIDLLEKRVNIGQEENKKKKNKKIKKNSTHFLEEKPNEIDYEKYFRKAIKLTNENKRDYFVELYKIFKLDEYFKTLNDVNFMIYIYLRYEKNVSLDVICKVLELEEQVIVYEKEVLLKLKEVLNKKISEYCKLVLK